MPDITIQDVPQAELDALESRAARHGRTRAAELRHLIHEAASEEMLVQELERASQAVARLDAAEQQVERVVGTAAPPRRRYRTHQPTPRTPK